jgi:hypothetical protein
MLDRTIYAAVLVAAGLLATPASAGFSRSEGQSAATVSAQATAATAAVPSASGAQKVRIAPIGSHPYGLSYPEWAAVWLQWAVAAPADRNPLLDQTGEFCAEGQRGPVWFLAGTWTGAPVSRECTVPAGTALFFPISFGYLLSLPDLPELVACGFPTDPWYLAEWHDPEWSQFVTDVLEDFVEPPSRSDKPTLTVDGRKVGKPKNFYVQSIIFSAQLPAHNFGAEIFDCDTPAFLTSPDVVWGYFALLYPLPPGEHTLRFTFRMSGFTLADTTYRLTVQGP